MNACDVEIEALRKQALETIMRLPDKKRAELWEELKRDGLVRPETRTK